VKKYEFANHGHEKSVEYSRVTLEVQELAPPETPAQLVSQGILLACAAFLLVGLLAFLVARRLM
jgi:hypothetical protein